MMNEQYIQSNTSDRRQDELVEFRDKLNENNIEDGPRYYTHRGYRPKEECSQVGDFGYFDEQEWDFICTKADYTEPDNEELLGHWALLDGRK